MHNTAVHGARVDQLSPATRPEQRRIRCAGRGQVLTEYVVIAGLLIASLGILTVFLVTFKEYGGRVLALVSSEYP